jgi:DNA-binding LacI/PurR family transcriptional regulator
VLASASPPTAMLSDNDVMAVAALGIAQELGLSVPDQLSLVAWDDSALCRLVRPAPTAVSSPFPRTGRRRCGCCSNCSPERGYVTRSNVY